MCLKLYTIDTGLLAQCRGTDVSLNSRPPRVGLELSVNGINSLLLTHRMTRLHGGQIMSLFNPLIIWIQSAISGLGTQTSRCLWYV